MMKQKNRKQEKQMSNFNVGDLVLVQLTPGAVGQRATVTDVYGDEYYGVRVQDSGLDTGLSGKFISLIKRNEGQPVTGVVGVGVGQPVTGEFEQSNENYALLVSRDELTAEQLRELYRIGDDWDCTEEEVNDALDDIFGEDDWTFEELKDRLGEYLYDRQNDDDDEDDDEDDEDEDDDIATESPSELRQNLNEVRAELEACRTRAADAEAKVASQEAEIKRLKLRAEVAEAECARLKAAQNIERTPGSEAQAKSGTEWRTSHAKVEQWYKEHPCVSKAWDIPVMDIVTGRTGLLAGFDYIIDDCPGSVASVRVSDGSIEQWHTSCLIPMEHVLTGIKSARSWTELFQPGSITLATSGSGIEVAKA